MDAVRQWALRVCICCALAGALQLLLPAKGAARVIKTVLALYILVSVLTPAHTAGWGEVRAQLEQPLAAAAPEASDELVREAALGALEARLTARLAGEGIHARVVAGADDGQLQVTAFLQNEAEAGQAQAILEEELNGAGSIHCRGMEGAL